MHFMNRRAFLKSAAGAGALAAGASLPTPAMSQRAAARALRLVPHADLANFDPIWSSAYIARNAGLLVWDMLYGMDATLQVQRQMVEAEQVSVKIITPCCFVMPERIAKTDPFKQINEYFGSGPIR